MENQNANLIHDAENIIKWSKGNVEYNQSLEKLTWYPSWDGTMGFLVSCDLRTVPIPAGGPKVLWAGVVQPIPPTLAGMVLAGIDGDDPRILRGIHLAELGARLLEVFPQLSWGIVDGGVLMFNVDPCTDEFYRAMRPTLPHLELVKYAVTGSTYVRLEIASDLTRVELGAFRWKTQKTT